MLAYLWQPFSDVLRPKFERPGRLFSLRTREGQHFHSIPSALARFAPAMMPEKPQERPLHCLVAPPKAPFYFRAFALKLNEGARFHRHPT